MFVETVVGAKTLSIFLLDLSNSCRDSFAG